MHQIELFVKYPIDVQNEELKKLVQQQKYRIWKKYGFSSIDNYQTFSERVPILLMRIFSTIKKQSMITKNIFGRKI